MGVPILLLGQSLVDAIIEVLVVGEDDMATDVVELAGGRVSAGSAAGRAAGDSRSLRG